MKKSLLRTAVLSLAALTLAGCSTHEGPPKSAAKLAYLQNMSGDFRLKLHHLPKSESEIYHELHVGKCTPNSSRSGMWSCQVYAHNEGKTFGAHDIKIIHEGGTWKAYNP
ncbi:hypothetical protein [Acidithiobacillus ferriphilus]|uniref:hypothetical protein n=1 Tax=Acidithiobacillus ferriphilus TaxID=1689834 RepID=UPI001C0722AC|nr:hypothetical protein [Acidithiobacillus ferriphilus]MBU2853342.1 hypothetical protein [Acidithiobacillus ferriphilus]